MRMKPIVQIVKLAVLLLATPLALAQNAERKLDSFARMDDQLKITTNDGVYLIKPYSPSIMETSFIPTGETYNRQSHAVVLQPGSLAATIKDSPATLVYATPGIVVTVTKSPFQISYSYKGKPLVAEKHGYLRTGQADTIDFVLDSDEALYGAGARAVGMNRRGQRFTLYNKAHYGYETESTLMNFTMPLALSSKLYALHFDNAHIGTLDFDSKKTNALTYETIGGRKTYQVIAGDTWQDLVGNYTKLTGRQPLPPRWAFGNFASRFGYHSEAEAKATIDKFIAAKIPVDAIIFDLFWFGNSIKGTMGNLSFFKENFPNPKKMIADLADKGVKTILITEPFVLTSSKRWQEAVDKKVLATDKAGAPYTFDFYFGNTGLIDIYSKSGHDWLWNIYRELHALGVAGWWGDLGEPEVHPSALQHATGSADQVHNIYGHDWARLIHEGTRREFPNERPFILMRAGYSGSQRFGMIPWSGDVNRTWGGLQSQTEIALQMGMQGVGYMHSDLGGFAGAMLDDELYTRWLQYGVFQPIFRPHAQEEVASEPVFREAKTMANAREAIRLRYKMLPYNYTLAFENNQLGLPLMRPLMYAEPGNSDLRKMSDSYLWGNDLLVTPIVQPGVTRKLIYFPAKHAWFDFFTDARHTGGITEAISLTPEKLPVFVRAGAFIPMTKVVQSTRDFSSREVDLHYYHDHTVATASGKMYDDDGSTAEAFEKGQYEMRRFASAFGGDTLSLVLTTQVGANYTAKEHGYILTVHNIAAKPQRVSLDGKPLVFSWNAKTRRVTFKVPASKTATRSATIKLAAGDQLS